MLGNLDALQLETLSHSLYQYSKLIGPNEEKKNLKLMQALRNRSFALLTSYRQQSLSISPSDIFFLSLSYAKMSDFTDVEGLQLVFEDLTSEVA